MENLQREIMIAEILSKAKEEVKKIEEDEQKNRYT
jgi:hypothetical protein